jgi:hypothetical protein
MLSLDRRNGKKHCVRPFEDWGKLIGDVPSATAILDRFLHHAEVLTIAGRSYRLRGKSATEAEASSTKENADDEPKPAIPPTGSARKKRAKTDTPGTVEATT